MRRSPTTRWAIAAIAIALAFGAGYGVRKAIDSGDRKATPASRLGIPLARARALPLGISRRTLLERFAGKPYETIPAPSSDLACVVYLVSDRPATAWQFCFRHEKLFSSTRVTR